MPPIFLFACAHAPTPYVQEGGPGAPPVPAPAPADAIAPRPFTLEELRAGLPVGTRLRLRIRKAGEPEREERWEVTSADAEGCVIASQVYDAAGQLVSDEGSARSTWVELNEHATFPAARTVKEASTVEVPAGRFDTWLYTVVGTPGEGGADFVKRYHFARNLPGPPVSFTIVDGKGTVLEMTLLERSGPG
jgi:hypothetical protein